MAKNSKAQVIPMRFEVVKIMYRNSEDGYSILKVNFTHYPSTYIPTSNLVVVGNFFAIQEEDEFEGEGYWTENPTYGHQFVLNWSKLFTPVSKKGTKKFLQRFVKGIGSKTAEAIVNHYEEDTLQKIRENWKNLTAVAGVGEKKAKLIHYKLTEHEKFEKIAMFVLQQGVGYKVCLRIYEAFGDKAVERIKENPYALCDVPKVGFVVADKFAKSFGLPLNNPLRIQAGILHYILVQMKQQGHLYLMRKPFVKDLAVLLSDKNDISSKLKKNEIEKAIDALTMSHKLTVEVSDAQDECVYLTGYSKVEGLIVSRLKTLIEEPRENLVSDAQVDAFVAEFEINNAIQFAEKQKQAIKMAMTQGISILTGGPGTGKTQTINSIIKCLKYHNPSATIVLAAPTGKAAKRMTQLTKMESKTIHRLINLIGNEIDEETDMIFADYLIVDESSMIDAYVFYKLINSIDENTRLLLVGDYEQLPSVGPGLILRDLINSNKVPTTRLTEIFRQAKESQIVMNSYKIINGHKTTGDDPLVFDHTKKDFFFIPKEDKMVIQGYLLKAIENSINNQGKTLADIQVLTPMRKGELGVYDLNKLIQKRFNPPHPSKEEIRTSVINVFRTGDRVIQTVNNYDLNVFNGEVGIVKCIERDGDDFAITVDYEDEKVIVYDNLTVEEMMLSYAMTVHKSQGSEFPVVIMPIHGSHEILLNRNILYTAWTRAQETVICVGSLSALNKAADKTDGTVRNSRIMEKIQKQIR